MALSCLSKEFPQIGKFLDTDLKEACLALVIVKKDTPEAVRQPPGDPDSPLPCSWSKRQFTNSPDSLPMPALASKREKLELFIRNWYAASLFNVCKT